MANPTKVDNPVTLALPAVMFLRTISSSTNKLFPTKRSPPVVVMPPLDARVVAPPTVKFLPTASPFSIPTPP